MTKKKSQDRASSQKSWQIFRKLTAVLHWEKLLPDVTSNLIVAVILAVCSLLAALFFGLHHSGDDERLSEASRAWTSVRNTTDPLRLKEYIAKYQGLKFAEYAQERLDTGRAWEQVGTSGSVEKLRKFLRNHSDPAYRKLAEKKIERLEETAAWKRAQKQGTADAYRNYLIAWSDGLHRNLAQQALNELDDKAWRIARNDNSVHAIREYLDKWRPARNKPAAEQHLSILEEREAWNKAKTADSVWSYEEYIRGWPQGRHLTTATARLRELKDNHAWEQATLSDTPSAYRTYTDAWKNGRHRAEARKRLAELDAAHWQNATKLNTIAAYQYYLDVWPSGEYAGDARVRNGRLEDAAEWKIALKADSQQAYQGYLVSYPRGQYYSMALAKLESLDNKAWDLVIKGASLSAYQTYLDNWPNGRHRKEVLEKIGKLDERAWKAAVKDETVGSFKEYLARWPEGNRRADAKKRISALLNPGPTDCDRLAANPDDPERVVAGTRFKYLQFDRAIRACKNAIQKFPDTLRFQYQLARAYQRGAQGGFAMPLLRELVAKGYTAAYDNLGWLFAKGDGVPKDIEMAIKLFQDASDAGSSEAMTSLGRVYWDAENSNDAKYWFQRAVDQGYQPAKKYLHALEQNQPREMSPEFKAIGAAALNIFIEKVLEKRRKK